MGGHSVNLLATPDGELQDRQIDSWMVSALSVFWLECQLSLVSKNVMLLMITE